jgi:hypothetical protein
MNRLPTLHLQSLASFRILLGLYILIKFIFSILLNFNEIFSTKNGILGNCYQIEYIKSYPSYGPFFSIRSDLSLIIVICFIILLALFFTVGLYPKICGFILFFFMAWFSERFSTLYFGWEAYFSCLFFLSLFLPLNAKFSLFPAKEPPIDKSYIFFSCLLFFQIGFIYFYNGISKNGYYWFSGDAVRLAISEIDKTTAFTQLLIDNAALSEVLSWMALLTEISIILFIFFPFKNHIFRYIAIVGILSFHWGISLFTDVGNFKYVAIIASVILLPPHFWQLGLVTKLSSKPFKTFHVPQWRIPFPTVLSIVFGVFLLSQMLFSNLAQTSLTKTDDRFGLLIKNMGMKKWVEKGWIIRKPYYSFFGQYWHLYSPNPPSETGYTTVEGIDMNGNKIFLDNGFQIQSASDISYQKKLLYAYITLRGNNKKDVIMSRCLLSREMNYFLSNPKNPRLKSVDLVTYSYKPSNTYDIKLTGREYTRIIRQQITLDY